MFISCDYFMSTNVLKMYQSHMIDICMIPGKSIHKY